MTKLHDECCKGNQGIINSHLLVSQDDGQQDFSRKKPPHNHSAAAPLRHPGSLQAEMELSIRRINGPSHFDKAFISAILSYHS